MAFVFACALAVEAIHDSKASHVLSHTPVGELAVTTSSALRRLMLTINAGAVASLSRFVWNSRAVSA